MRGTDLGSPQGGVISPFLANIYLDALDGIRRIRELTDRRRWTGLQDIREVVAVLNPVLRGWGNYFRTADASSKFQQVDRYANQRLVRLPPRVREWRRRPFDLREWAIGLALFFLSGCGSAAVPPTGPASRPDPVLVGAGDIARCDGDGDEATAGVLDRVFPPDASVESGIVFTLGDNAYESGSLGEYMACFDPTWGRHRTRMRPAVGNHEYRTPGAQGYFTYFGAAAGDPARGYYSYDLGAWHLIVLNSNCDEVGGCGAGSPQERWLRADLAARPAKCTLAYWHHPLFSSGVRHGGDAAMKDVWQTLQSFSVDLVLAAHEHQYERFAPQDAEGRADAAGIREFVVGTGGGGLYPFGSPRPNSEIRGAEYGVLKLNLHPAGYDWEFLPAAGASFTDAGSGTCH